MSPFYRKKSWRPELATLAHIRTIGQFGKPVDYVIEWAKKNQTNIQFSESASLYFDFDI